MAELSARASEQSLRESERRLQVSKKCLKLLQESNASIARFQQELFPSSPPLLRQPRPQRPYGVGSRQPGQSD